jgi:hypothetical protein
MIIEQSKDQVNDAIGFHTHADIGSVRLTRAKIWSRERITQAAAHDFDFDIGFKPGSLASEQDGSLFLETEFMFSISESQKEESESSVEQFERRPLISIECCFETEYRFKDYTPSDRQIEAFRSANAVFNCWPFFREFVRASVTRMDFPPPSVPFLRLVPKRDTPEASPEQSVTPVRRDDPTPATHL